MGYKDLILIDSPVVYYRLGDNVTLSGSGSVAMADLSGNARNGTFTANVSPFPGAIPGDADAATYFASAVANASTTNNAALNFVNGIMTVECWFKQVSGG